MLVSDYVTGKERLKDAIKTLATGRGSILERIKHARDKDLHFIWHRDLPASLWFDLRTILEDLKKDELSEDKAVFIAGRLVNIACQMETETEM